MDDGRSCQVDKPTSLLIIIIDCDADSIVQSQGIQLEILMQVDSDLEGTTGDGFDISLACARLARLAAGIIIGVVVKFQCASLSDDLKAKASEWTHWIVVVWRAG